MAEEVLSYRDNSDSGLDGFEELPTAGGFCSYQESSGEYPPDFFQSRSYDVLPEVFDALLVYF